MQIVLRVVIESLLPVVDSIRLTPAEQTCQLGRQHSGTLWRQVEHFAIIHSGLSLRFDRSLFTCFHDSNIDRMTAEFRNSQLLVSLAPGSMNYCAFGGCRFVDDRSVCTFNEHYSFTVFPPLNSIKAA